MSQGLRDLLANRKFAIPLIVLMAFCFIGLLLIGIVLIWRPGASTDETTPVAQVTEGADMVTATMEPTTTPEPTDTATPKPTPTLVPVGTPVSSAGGAGTPVSSTGGDATPAATTAATAAAAATISSQPTSATTSGEGAGAQPTTAPVVEDEELAQTGVGWGLILVSGLGLAALVVAARRIRLAS